MFLVFYGLLFFSKFIYTFLQSYIMRYTRRPYLNAIIKSNQMDMSGGTVGWDAREGISHERASSWNYLMGGVAGGSPVVPRDGRK